MLEFTRRVILASTCALLAALAIGCPSETNIGGSGGGEPELIGDADGQTQNHPQPEDESSDTPAAADEHSADEPHQHTNRLADETSPYLLLHAHNPVDWYPWGEEALAKAKREGKPIFLSVGYSSCYWCHVMERESFMDQEIAEFLSKHFVCIKIDREERPDIDNIYMTSLHVYFEFVRVNRSGGWPLSMFLTPDAKPILGGTYWPARDDERTGRPGFLTVISKVHELWTNEKESLEHNADIIADAVKQRLRGRRPVEVGDLEPKMIQSVWEDLRDDFDPTWGGFGYNVSNPKRPKFPEPSNLLFLIERVERQDIEQWEEARETLTVTLDKMAQGGIYDHLGGGFHRYSTDRFWRIPHFEKMLYDNGQLATIYARAYKLTGNEEYRHTVEGILEFVQREMMDEGGAFYAALDAETDAEEGKFYRWKKEELDRLLGEKDRALFGEIYNLNGEPNFEDEYYVPMLSKSLAEHAKERGMTLEELRLQLEPLRKRLLAARNERKRPLTDTKILTGWNGLMIRGFADAGRLLENKDYAETAGDAAAFVLANSRKDGRLLRTYTAGEAKLNAYVDDYAFLIDGLIALQRASGPLSTKIDLLVPDLMDKQIELFWDGRDGGFFYTSDDHEELIARAKNPVDNVIPAGNSVSAGNLLYLAGELENEEYLKKAQQTMLSSAVHLRASPSAVPRMAVHVAQFLAEQEKEGSGESGEE